MISIVTASLLAGIPTAHVGHWLANLLYLLPVVVLAGGIAYQRIADRKARAADQAEEAAGRPDEHEAE